MRRRSYRKLFFLGLALSCLFLLPPLFVQSLRGRMIGLLRPFWHRSAPLDSVQRLEAENHLLRVELAKLREAKEATHPDVVPAHIVFRDPATWASVFWIDVGECTNKALGREVISKQSPVLIGRSVVGAIDYVGKRQSRVRLLTDRRLQPSVRAVRGSPQNAFLTEHLEIVLRALAVRTDLPLAREEINRLRAELGVLKNRLSQNLEGWYLAKGVVQGAGMPLWRSRNALLKGVGFNCDFGDQEGPARELQTGRPLDLLSAAPAMPILKEGDLLVTTGMDGFFPPGLRVAEVTKVFPLREGAYTYDLEAVPAVGNLNELKTVYVLPPMGYDPEDHP